MNPSILRTEMSWRNDPSWSALKRLYGGEPLVPDEPEPPPEGPGVVTIQDGRFIFSVTRPGTYEFKVIEGSGI